MQHYDEFTVLSKEENELAKQILDLAAQDINKLKIFIEEEVDLVDLIKLIFNESKIKEILSQKEFDAFWLTILRGCKTSARNFKFEPLPTITNLNLVMGLFLYMNYTKLEREKILKNCDEHYLINAADFDHFPAINRVYKSILASMEQERKLVKESNSENKIQSINQIRSLAMKVRDYAHKALKYQTPGLILFSKICLELKLYSEYTTLRNDELLTASLAALIGAEKLLSDSTAFINNAYQGKNLVEAQADNVNDWSTSKTRVMSLFFNLPSTEKTNCIENAYKLGEKIVNRFKNCSDMPSITLLTAGH